MEFAAFLPDDPDACLRARLWGLFVPAEAEAARFVLPGDWQPAHAVVAGVDDTWCDGAITLNVRADEPGALIGLVFAAAFRRSRFYNGGSDGQWGPAWADAFRYFLEQRLGLAERSAWFAAVDRFCGQSPEAALAQPGGLDRGRIVRGCYPASLLIARAGKDFAMFRAIWFDLQEQRMQANQPLLEWKFGYSIPAD